MSVDSWHSPEKESVPFQFTNASTLPLGDPIVPQERVGVFRQELDVLNHLMN